jgi:hypothetical protein
MPKWSDDIYLGGAKIPSPADPLNPSPMTEGVGPVGRIYVWDAVPATQGANVLALSQSTTAGGNLVLTAGANVTTRIGTDNLPQMVLDVPRTLVVAGTAVYPVTAFGFDQYGMPMTETFAAAGTGKKAFKVVSRVTAGAVGTVATVGTSNVLGLPYRLADLGYIMTTKFNGATEAPTIVVADGNTATATTGDVRGTYTPATALDGIKRLVVTIALSGIQAGPNATRLGAAGVNQF